MPVTNIASAAEASRNSALFAGNGGIVGRATSGNGSLGGVEAAIRSAAERTGVDFSYLLEKAAAESGMRTDVTASTSSATGLYQFIDSTWLNTLKEHGADHGLGRYANMIQTRSDGRNFVADPAMRKEIMDLRKDPEVSALMAAEFTRDNKEFLEKNTTGDIGSTELYLAHFLGAGGGAKFLNALRDSPNATAKDLFPQAAAANKGVFYDRESGKPTTLKQIYDRFAAKFSEDGVNISPSDAVARRLRSGMPGGFEVQTPNTITNGGAANVLSIYQVLALNALDTPDETDLTQSSGTNPDGRDPSQRKMRYQPVRTDQTNGTRLGLGLGRADGAPVVVSA